MDWKDTVNLGWWSIAFMDFSSLFKVRAASFIGHLYLT